MLLSMFQSVCSSGGGGCSSRNRTNIAAGGPIAVKRERIDDDECQRKATCNSGSSASDEILSDKVCSLSQSICCHHFAPRCASSRILSSTDPSLLQDRADSHIRGRNWRRCTTHERFQDIGMMPCPNLEHDDFDVLPAERNGHCLFLCFVDILRERGVAGSPDTHQAMRSAIADYFDQHGGMVSYQGVQYPCDEEIRTNGYGSVTEALAFATMYKVSIEIHSPETPEYVQMFTCGISEAAPELLLQTLGWQDDGSRAAAGDHWQRLRTKIDVKQHSMEEGNLSRIIPAVRRSNGLAISDGGGDGRSNCSTTTDSIDQLLSRCICLYSKAVCTSAQPW